MEFKEFFEFIFGDNDGYAFIGTLDEDNKLNHYKPFKYPESLGPMVKYVEMRTDIDVYFSPMLYSVPRRSGRTVSSTPVVYADTDTFNPDNYIIAPSLNVQTSGDKTHSYWVLDDIYTPDAVSTAARAIALTHASKVNGKQAGVDPGGWDLSQMLRVPGTMNTNPQNKLDQDALPVTIRNITGAIYSLEEITDAYDPDNLPATVVAHDEEMPEELPKTSDVLRKLTNDPHLNKMYSKTVRGDWSDELYAFCSEMFRRGFTAEEVLVAAWQVSYNKYKRDGRPMSDLWKYDVLKASADPENRPRSKVDRIAEPPVNRPKDEGLVVAALESTLLTAAERELITETFIDRYVGWAASKTDAPAAYHVASAFTILSCVLGEWGVAYPQFGELRLGMFFVVMGETTRTRKSTARNLMKKLLRMTQMGDYKYLLSSDITPETLIDKLSERAHQSSLYDRDEGQQLIHDIKHKGYLNGFFETLNELYDGWAHGRDRKDKSTEDTQVNFVQYLMGIRSQIQDNLEVKDFTSGWGPRNIFVRGDAPPRTRENSRLKQGNPDASESDAEFLKIVKLVTDSRAFWSRKVKNREAPMRIFFDDDAWERWDDFSWALGNYVDDHPRSEMLVPAAERLGINIIKVAVLLAMMDQRTTVSMVDVLNAIYYGVQWVEDLIIVAEGVAESVHGRDLAKLEEYIVSKNGLVTYAAALKWSIGQGKIKREFDAMVETLRDSEVIQIVEDAKGKPSLEITYSGF